MDYFKKTKEQEIAVKEFKSKRAYYDERSFDLSDSVEINDKFLTELCQTFRSLSIHKKNITDFELGVILKHCVNLELLEIYGFLNITLEGLEAIECQNLNLVSLEIVESFHITNKGVALIAEKFPNLQDLTLQFCSGVTDEGLKHIGNKCSNLVSLDLDMCNVTQECVKNIVQQCPKLIALHIEHSIKLREEGLDILFSYLSEKFPYLGIYLH